MNTRIYEIPQSLAKLLRTVGPIAEEVRGGYCFAIHVVVRDDHSCAGFLVEQRLAQKSPRCAENEGISFKVPAKSDSQAEPTFVFAETLPAAMEYLRGQAPPAEGGVADK